MNRKNENITLNEGIGARLKKLRTEKRVTQEKMAEELDFSREHISGLERRTTTLSETTLIRIVNYFDVSADYILFGKNIAKAEKETLEILELLKRIMEILDNKK